MDRQHRGNDRFGGRGHRGGGRGGRGRGRGRGGRGGGRGSFWFKGEGYDDHELIGISEDAVGIRGYLNNEQAGFPGQVKQRYCDLVVHEITRNGRIVTLKSLARRKKTIKAQFFDLVSEFIFTEEINNSFKANMANTQHPIIPIPHEMTQQHQILRLLTRKLNGYDMKLNTQSITFLETYHYHKLIQLVTKQLGPKMGREFTQFIERVKIHKQQYESDQTSNEKEDLIFYIGGLEKKSERVFIHESMRRYGKGLIVADTIIPPNQSTQVIRIRPLLIATQQDKSQRSDWPVDLPDYTQFVVYKKNKDIVAVLNQIASILHINPNVFSYAEVKEKRGITTQLCTAYRISKEMFYQLKFYNRSLSEQQFLIGDVKYVPHKMIQEDCIGNAYSMVIRQVPSSWNDQKLSIAIQSWITHGFINFFAPHRFGSGSTPYHVIGRALLRRDYKLAVLLLLRPQEGESTKIRQAREHFRQHKDIAAALRMFPPFLIAERHVLEGLSQHGIEANELAFRKIEGSLRARYVESYQQYLWNQMASLRIREHSSTLAIVGDLVYDKHLKRVVPLTEATVTQYSIEDVLLPVPGFNIIYPSNGIGDKYKKILAMDGIDMASWEGPTQSTNHHPYDVSGSYRAIVVKPMLVEHEVKTYTDAIQPLVMTDVDHMMGLTAPSMEMKKQRNDTEGSSDTQMEVTTVALEQRALILHFRLNYGSDATIAIRELLKQSSTTHVMESKGQSDAHSIKRSLTSTSSMPNKFAKASASSRPQVAIGRPGFSLGKSG